MQSRSVAFGPAAPVRRSDVADLDRVRRWAEALITLHLDPTWTFGFDRARTGAGLCDYRARRITVSRLLAERFDDDDIHQVLLHEVAHARRTAGRVTERPGSGSRARSATSAVARTARASPTNSPLGRGLPQRAPPLPVQATDPRGLVWALLAAVRAAVRIAWRHRRSRVARTLGDMSSGQWLIAPDGVSWFFDAGGDSPRLRGGPAPRACRDLGEWLAARYPGSTRGERRTRPRRRHRAPRRDRRPRDRRRRPRVAAPRPRRHAQPLCRAPRHPARARGGRRQAGATRLRVAQALATLARDAVGHLAVEPERFAAATTPRADACSATSRAR